MNDELAHAVERLWRQSFDEAMLIPVIGVPSTADGVMTLTHDMGDDLMSINGQPSRSPLANYALYSAECSQNLYLNLYEVMIPDIPGRHGNYSTAEFYVNRLRDLGLDVAGVHFHWWGQHVLDCDRGVIAIHHQKSGMHPLEFSRRTIAALEAVGNLLQEREGPCPNQ